MAWRNTSVSPARTETRTPRGRSAPKEASIAPRLSFDKLVEHNIIHRCPTTRVRVRDFAGRDLALLGHMHADPPGSVPGDWSVREARYGQWAYLKKFHESFTFEGHVDLRDCDFVYETQILGKSEIFGRLPKEAIVTAIKPNKRPPFGEGPMRTHGLYRVSISPSISPSTAPPTPPTPPTTPPTPP